VTPSAFTCPRCHAAALAPCTPVDGDIPEGYTHRARSEAWAMAQPRPARAVVTLYDDGYEPVEPGPGQVRIG
jgi:hypothetical protein